MKVYIVVVVIDKLFLSWSTEYFFVELVYSVGDEILTNS